jgi:hypothetical protein
MKERNNPMFKLIAIVLALLAGYVLWQSLPDIRRYLRISSM